MKTTTRTKSRFQREYGKLLKMNNAVDSAAPASVWGKGVPGKGGATRNFEIPEWMFKRELEEMMEERANA